MPSDVVTIVVSTGIGVSVIAGFVSGVCYILTQGYTKKTSRKPSLQWNCAVCGSYLRSFTENIKVVICLECEERVCRLRCSKRDYVRKGWICYTCLKRPSWLQSVIDSVHLHFKQKSSVKGIKAIASEKGEDMEEENDVHKKRDKDCVRDVIEKLVATILGENVDDASIYRIYNDKHYDTLFHRYHQDLSNAITNLSSSLNMSIKYKQFSQEGHTSAHIILKNLIEKVLQEAANLPNFRKTVDNPSSLPGEKGRTYEELLATAIINKIISKQEDEVASSSAASISGHKANKEHFSKDHSWESKWRHTDLESTSVSSLDEYLYSDSSIGSSKYVDRLSLTIQHQIEEMSPIDLQEGIGNEIEYLQTTSPNLLSNEDSNWHLQKRQFPGSRSPVPVPMLVPNPITNAKVLIGDKELDDTSDLSDAVTDDDEAAVPVSPNKNFVIDSDITIDANDAVLNNCSSDDNTSFDSGVREDRDDFNDKEKTYHFKSRTDLTVDDDNVDDISLMSSYSHTEKDTEYLEKYASLPKAVYSNTSPSSRSLEYVTQEQNLEEKYKDLDNRKSVEKTEEPFMNEDENTVPVFEGSYSKKEKEKWSHPISMPNNPYCEENIRKRIQKNERFGREYYTKQASLPSGRPKYDEDGNLWQIGSYSPTDSSNFFKAEPVSTKEESEELSSVEAANSTLSEFLSNSEPSLVNCYDVENSTIYHKPLSNEEMKFEIKLNQKEPVSPNFDEIDGIISPVVVKKFEIRLNEKVPVEPEEKVACLKTDMDYIAKQEDQNNNIDISTNVISKTPNIEQVPVARERLKLQTTKKAKVVSNPPTPTTPNTPTYIPKKSDNTLIKKIYSDPIVRSFALTNREQIPVKLNNTITPLDKKSNIEPSSAFRTEDVPKKPVKTAAESRMVVRTISESSDHVVAKDILTKVNSLEERDELNLANNFSLDMSDNETVMKEPCELENEFIELKEKRLVTHLLGQFSKSYPNLNNITNISPTQKEDIKVVHKLKHVPSENNLESDMSVEESFVSVKQLKRLFEKNDISNYNKDKPVHSLTARSISKQIKEKLKNFDNNRNDNSPKIANKNQRSVSESEA